MTWDWTDFYLWGVRTTRKLAADSTFQHQLSMLTGQYAALAQFRPAGFSQFMPGVERKRKISPEEAERSRERAREISDAVKRNHKKMVM